MELFDTHCHIHEAGASYPGATPSHNKWSDAGIADPVTLVSDAAEAGVTRAVCVGTTLEDSTRAIDFVQPHPGLWASIGLHPHEARLYAAQHERLAAFAALATQPKVVAVGECGLDYYYTHSPRQAQIAVLEFQLDLAQRYDLALMFHIREAFDDFWPVFDNFRGLRGIVHSFTANSVILDQALSRGLLIGLNGIMTFTKDEAQLAAAKAIPNDRLVLETDAPYLTPAPYRGKICTPRHLATTAAFIASVRGEPLGALAASTTANARKLLRI